MSKPFLILQLRPEDAASDDELAAYMRIGGIAESEVHRVRMEQESIPELDLSKYSAVIVGGGPTYVSTPKDQKSSIQQRFEAQLEPLMRKIIDTDFPYLGACSGLSYLVHHAGGRVGKERYSEGVGAFSVHLTDAATDDELTGELPKNFRAFGGHNESVQELPDGAVVLGGSDVCPVHILRLKQNLYGVQFHCELDVDGIILRIRTYKHAGYFPPEDADRLIAEAQKETVTEPGKILKNFVDRYRRD